MRKLDRIDRMILEILQKQGRIAISELAAMVNLSTTPCSERVKRLERDGIIMGYHARLSPELLDKRLLVFLEIKLSAKSGDVFDQVARDLVEIPERFFPAGPLTFTVGLMADAADKDLANAYITWLTSPQGQAFFEQAGFIPAISPKGQELIEKLGVKDVA